MTLPWRNPNPRFEDQISLGQKKMASGSLGRVQSAAPVRPQRTVGRPAKGGGGFGNLYEDVATSDVCDLGGLGTGPPFVFSTYPVWMDGSNIIAAGIYVASMKISIVDAPSSTILQGYFPGFPGSSIPTSLSTSPFGGGGYPPPPGLVIIGVWGFGPDDVPVDVVDYSFNAIPPDVELNIQLVIQRLAWPA